MERGKIMAIEYFCYNCGQLRLVPFEIKTNAKRICGNCGSTNTIKGAPGSLNKKQLKAEFGGRKSIDNH
ncbi:MAG: hypothetical protein CMB80_02335 [Flammeovirgaceae bacterium]|nr:hypothetical protein [Flammeovirgaceae bacterium]